MIHRVLYKSRVRLPGSAAESAAVLDALLAVSRQRNTKANLTGALLFAQGTFIQLLEGPQAPLEQRFEAICRDLRHTDLELIDYSACSQRAFGAWSMADVTRSQRLTDADGPDAPLLQSFLTSDNPGDIVAGLRGWLDLEPTSSPSRDGATTPPPTTPRT